MDIDIVDNVNIKYHIILRGALKIKVSKKFTKFKKGGGKSQKSKSLHIKKVDYFGIRGEGPGLRFSQIQTNENHNKFHGTVANAWLKIKVTILLGPY